MSDTGATVGASMEASEVGTIDMKLEVVTLPVSDIDRAKGFYQSLGWRFDGDIRWGEFRGIQFTPPRSELNTGNTVAMIHSAPTQIADFLAELIPLS